MQFVAQTPNVRHDSVAAVLEIFFLPHCFEQFFRWHHSSAVRRQIPENIKFQWGEVDVFVVQRAAMRGLVDDQPTNINFFDERLIGAVIVGTGLPMVCVEQEVLRGYFEEKEEAGFDFAYQYTGMNKVLQAAGRVIRTTEDEGIILLLDDRFLKKEYLELFPREWEHFQMVNRKNVGQCLSDFWESRGR